MRIAVVTSQTAPGVEALVLAARDTPLFEVSMVVSSSGSLDCEDALRTLGIPVAIHPMARPDAGTPRSAEEREAWDRELATILGDADYVFLADHRYLVTAPLLEAFPQRIIDFHDGDLSIRGEDGARSYAGPHAVREALLAGEPHTRAAAFLVTERAGEGPLLLLSGRWPVSPLVRAAVRRGAYDEIERYANLHRSWMLHEAFPRLMCGAAEILAAGTLQIVGDVVWIDGVPGACRLGDSPDACEETPPEAGIPASCPFISQTR